MFRASLGMAVAMATFFVSALLPVAGAAPVVPVSSNLGCDPIDPAACLLPFPNDFFTVADGLTDTGRRVNFSPAAMPRSGTEVTEGGEGKPVDPTEWNRNDGFSPGSAVMTYVEGLDLHRTWETEDRPHGGVPINTPGYFDHRDHIADIGLYESAEAPIIILNAETGERHPFWSELDQHAGAVDGDEQVLILRPAVNFDEGTRYIVALRNMKDSSSDKLEPGAAFQALADGTSSDAARQAHYDANIFPILDSAEDIGRQELYLAWDFTVASERNLSERALHMRNDAFGRILGDTNLENQVVEGSSPDFVVDSTSEFTDTWTDSHGVSHSQLYRRIEGRVTVPNYLDRIQQTESHTRAPGTIPDYPQEMKDVLQQLPDDFPDEIRDPDQPVEGVQYDVPAPGSRLLDLNRDGLPDQNPVESTINAFFVCEIPLNGKENHPGLYGHGLLGQARDQIQDFRRSPGRWGPFFGCAADWWGMATQDLPTVAAIVNDVSLFPTIPDRAQQGFLNFMFIGRAAIHPDGFVTDPAFQQNGQPLIDAGPEAPLFYDGNSQGGIMGGSLVALSPDIRRGVLGVPGMNYSTLLNRSVDYEGEVYSVPTYAHYTDPIERQIIFSLMQMLWDRGEANGYAHHMTDDPYANTPPHEVMLQVAYSDHQVANISAEVEARTIGAPIMEGMAPGRHWDFAHLEPRAEYPEQGSALIYWDSGNATPPNGNLPPDHSFDPHGHTRSEPAAGWQEAQFLLTGWMVDVCDVDGGGFYYTDNNPINGGTIRDNGTPGCKAPLYEPGTVIPTEESGAVEGTGEDVPA